MLSRCRLLRPWKLSHACCSIPIQPQNTSTATRHDSGSPTPRYFPCWLVTYRCGIHRAQKIPRDSPQPMSQNTPSDIHRSHGQQRYKPSRQIHWWPFPVCFDNVCRLSSAQLQRTGHGDTMSRKNASGGGSRGLPACQLVFSCRDQYKPSHCLPRLPRAETSSRTWSVDTTTAVRVWILSVFLHPESHLGWHIRKAWIQLETPDHPVPRRKSGDVPSRRTPATEEVAVYAEHNSRCDPRLCLPNVNRLSAI